MSLRKGNTIISGLGTDGYSPSATVEQNNDITTITITDKEGTTTAQIDLSDKQEIMQYDTIPTASAENLGKIIQYTGVTNSTYTNGYFYIGTTDGGDPATYSWENINVQEGVTNLKTIDGESLLGTGNIETARVLYINANSIDLSAETTNKFITDVINSSLFNTDKKDFFIHSETFGFCPVYVSNSTAYTLYVRVYVTADVVASTTTTSNYGVTYKYSGPSTFSVYIKREEFDNLEATEVFSSSDVTTKSTVTMSNPSGFILNSTSYLIGRTNTTSFTPTSNYHPATKKYVDDKVSNINLSNYLSKTNTTAYTPTSDYHPATKKYVDDKIGDVDFSNILQKDNTDVFVPTGAYNPATKDYVDSLVATVNHLEFEVVTALPSSGILTSVIYLVGSANPYDIYVYSNNQWVLLGTTSINIEPTVIIDNGTTYTINSLTGHKSYKLGELTNLTIDATTIFDLETVIYFSSGTTGTSVSIPDSLVNLGDYPTLTATNGINTGVCQAEKSYIISVLNNIAVWKAY